MNKLIDEHKTDYRYIDQEIIDSGVINAVNSDVFAEADSYNGVMVREYARKHRVNAEFYTWCGVLTVMMFAGLYISVNFYRYRDPAYKHILALIAAVLFFFCFVYFIIARGHRNTKMAALIGLPLVYLCPVLVIAYAANIYICRLYEKYDRSISVIPGYPKFRQLTITTNYGCDIYGKKLPVEAAAHMDETDSGEPEDPFAKYRIKPEDDTGMLSDSSI